MIKITMEVDKVPDNFTGITEFANGNKSWYKNGELHREDGPAVLYSNGDKFWYKNHKLHRIDGPAVEHADGRKYWYKEDKLHRLDGPAAEYSNGVNYWYIDGKEYTEEEFNKKINNCEGKVVEIEGKKYKLVLSD